MKFYVARDENAKLWLYEVKPEKNEDYGEWEQKNGTLLFQIKEMNNEFKNIKWNDNEPTECELKIVKQ